MAKEKVETKTLDKKSKSSAKTQKAQKKPAFADEKPEKVKKPKRRKDVFEREHTFEWEPGDETLLQYAIEDKLHSLNQDINDASSPRQRNKLKAERKAYRNMQSKVKAGNYGSVDLYKKLARAGIKIDASNRGKGSVSRYDTIDFKFDQYFLKTRYYGLASPLLIILLTVILVATMILSMVIPSNIKTKLDEIGLNITSLYTFKLSESEDLLAPNNGAWPPGTWQEGATAKQGEKYVSPTGEIPDVVRLYGQLGMATVDITLFDLVNAFFNWSVSPAYKLNFIEDSSLMQSADMYYSRFMLEKDEFLSFSKQADGTYNTQNLFYILAVYGTLISIICLMFCIICALVSSFLSLFTYTGRRPHFYAIGMIVFGLLAALLPMFLAIPSGLEAGACISPYFSFLTTRLLANESAIIMLNIPLLLVVALGAVILCAPKFFKNKPIKLPTHVPKGNRPPTQALVANAQKSSTTETKVITRTRTVTKTYKPSSYSIGKNGPGLQFGKNGVQTPRLNVAPPPQFNKKK